MVNKAPLAFQAKKPRRAPLWALETVDAIVQLLKTGEQLPLFLEVQQMRKGLAIHRVQKIREARKEIWESLPDNEHFTQYNWAVQMYDTGEISGTEGPLYGILVDLPLERKHEPAPSTQAWLGGVRQLLEEKKDEVQKKKPGERDDIDDVLKQHGYF